MRWRPLQRASTITFTLRTVEICPAVRVRHNNSMQRTALRAAADAARVCRACCHARGGKSPVQVYVEPKDKGSARASPRGGVRRQRGTNVWGEGHEPDTRCGTLGASGHATAKPSIHSGACFIHPAPMHGRYDSLPRETSQVPREVACHGNWLRGA
jgi:hypothetical protein